MTLKYLTVRMTALLYLMIGGGFQLQAQEMRELLSTNAQTDMHRGTAAHIDYVQLLPQPINAGQSATQTRTKLPRQPLDLNTTSLEDLMTVPGMDERQARRIIAYRNKAGQFYTVDDLLLVRGIDPKRLEMLRVWVKVKRNDVAMPIDPQKAEPAPAVASPDVGVAP